MRKLTHEEYEKRLQEDGRGYFALEEYSGATKPILHQCPAGHRHTARPSDLLSGKGCRECANDRLRAERAFTHDDYAAWLESDRRGWRVLGRYHNNHRAIKHRCPEGHEFDAKPSKLKTGRGCPICSNRVPLTPEDYQSYLSSDPRGFVAVQPYAGVHTKITHRCPHGHEWEVMPSSIRSGKYGCPYCSGYAPQDYAEVLAECVASATMVPNDLIH